MGLHFFLGGGMVLLLLFIICFGFDLVPFWSHVKVSFFLLVNSEISDKSFIEL